MKSYSGQNLDVRGKMNVNILHNGQWFMLLLNVVDNDGPALLARNWLQTLKLDWSTVSKVNFVDDVIDK